MRQNLVTLIRVVCIQPAVYFSGSSCVANPTSGLMRLDVFMKGFGLSRALKKNEHRHRSLGERR